MRRFLILALFLIPTPLFAKDIYLSIAGTVNNFHTDARVFNPSFTKDIEVAATFLPVGNVDNNGRTSVTITVPKRQMRVLDDVVTAVFSTSGLGAIRLTSSDDFEATSRIYAQTATGTLGQFVPGLQPGEAKTKGALLQLKSSATFRTNLGAVNSANATTNVVWKLYDKNNAVVSTKNETMQPFGVIAPSNIAGYFAGVTADLSDAWISFTSDNPIFAYGSVIDNATTDPTFIPAVGDTGVAPPATPTAKVYNVTLRSFAIEVSPPFDVKKGDQVTLRISCRDATHGFEVTSPSNKVIVPSDFYDPGDTAEKTFTINEQGTYFYFCTNTVCGTGHLNMEGSFVSGQPSDDDPRGY